jgi:hypothetical protein
MGIGSEYNDSTRPDKGSTMTTTTVTTIMRMAVGDGATTTE